MSTVSAGAEDGVHLAPAVRILAWIGLALLAGWVVVALEGLGPARHRAAVLFIGVAAPALIIFLAWPLVGFQLYLATLPLVGAQAVVGGLNGGEVLTLGVLALGGATFWTVRERLGDALRTLAPILWPIAALSVVSVASVVVNGATAPAEILSALLKILAFGLIAVLVYLHASTWSRARALLVAVLIGAFLEAAYSLVTFAVGLDYYATYGYHRATGTFSTWNHLGGFMALTSVPTLAFALQAERRKVRWLFLGFFAAEIVALLLSLTLGSILGLLVAGVIAGLFLVRIPVRRIGMGLLAFGLVFLTVFAASADLRYKIANIGGRVVDRLITYAVGVSMLQDRLWFGFGSQSRVAEALFDPTRAYRFTVFGESGVVPHASVLSVGVEKGIFGVLFFVLLVIGAIRLLVAQRERFRTPRQAILYQGLVVGALAFLVQDMTNNLLLHARLGIIFITLVTLTVAMGQLASREAGQP